MSSFLELFPAPETHLHTELKTEEQKQKLPKLKHVRYGEPCYNTWFKRWNEPDDSERVVSWSECYMRVASVAKDCVLY